MNTETIPIGDLTPDPANARKHDERNLKAIIDSLRAFGQQKPIVVDRRGVVIAGNGTLEAAKRLGWDEIAIVRTDLDPTQATAYGIADNRTAELAEWDEEVLVSLLDSLDDETRDLMHFDQKELDALLPKHTVEVVEDEVPEKVEPRTKPGDLWLLGRHRVLCGDSTNADDVARLMDGNKASLLFTDPPYGVDYEGITNDDAAGLPSLLAGAFEQADRAMQPGACFYICHPDIHAFEFIQAVRSVGWKQARPSVVLWVKDRFVLGRGDYHSQSEPILYGWKKGAPHHAVSDRTESNVWEYPRPATAEGHPTIKPLALVGRAIQNSTRADAIVLDLFLGSGSSVVAAEETGRRCFGMEIEPGYCDVIVKRWENLTGEEAVLADA